MDTRASSPRAAPRCHRGARRLWVQHRCLGKISTIHLQIKRPPPPSCLLDQRAMASNTFTAFSAARPSAVRTATRPQDTAYVEHPGTFRRPRLLSSERRPCRQTKKRFSQQKAFDPDKPFLMYWASRAPWPRAALRKNGPTNSGKFDNQRWDKYRERGRPACQTHQLDTVGCATDPRNQPLSLHGIRSRTARSPSRGGGKEPELSTSTCTDGPRGLDEIDRLGYRRDTLEKNIWGDNGASAEGQEGTISELLAQNGIPGATQQQIRGTQHAWAVSMCSAGLKPTRCIMPAGPGQAVRLIRRLSSSPRGGTRNPVWLSLACKYSREHEAPPRAQFLHVNEPRGADHL